MKTIILLSKRLVLTILMLSVFGTFAHAAKRSFYQIRIYTISSSDQEQMLDDYLKNAYIPAMHRQGIASVGVFKPRATTEDAGKKVYVFTPLKAQKQLLTIEQKLATDAAYQSAGNAYINASFDHKPYDRYETIILQAFTEMPQMAEPKLSGPRADRIYELRSYEGPTEKLYLKKVEMFNEGGEVALFTRINANAVFYGEVIVGSHQPNLMYMTTYENQADRDEHWKAFGTSPEWAKLKVQSQYDNTVSKNTQYFLYPTEYSDF